VPSLEELARRGVGGILRTETVAAFAVLAIFPLVVRWVMRRPRAAKGDESH
jgi:hypothetical protein